MNPIHRLRFDALAGYSRHPAALMLGEEVGWFEAANERVLGVLIRDRTDGDFLGAVLAPDAKGRYRAVDMTAATALASDALQLLSDALDICGRQDPANHVQGDEVGRSIDFFASVVSEEQLHPSFRLLSRGETYSPARGIIAAMMKYYEDVDGNFIEQFQTTGFDARIWELYLFAAFTELGFLIDRTNPFPDFCCKAFDAEFYVEATTANPRQLDGQAQEVDPPPTQAALAQYLREYVPIKFGSSLYTKLQKRYWEHAHVKGKPLVFALQDFHRKGSMVYTGTSLIEYCLGIRQTAARDSKGQLTILTDKIREHRYGPKVIPSGFFDLEGAENVSAVMFNSSGTISKFNRMGYLGGFGSHRVRMIRAGTCVDHDANASEPETFRLDVNHPNYSEDWVEGLTVIHNPRALLPLPRDWIPGASHHYMEGKTPVSERPGVSSFRFDHDDNYRRKCSDGPKGLVAALYVVQYVARFGCHVPCLR
jgi:hypothetical protein